MKYKILPNIIEPAYPVTTLVKTRSGDRCPLTIPCTTVYSISIKEAPHACLLFRDKKIDGCHIPAVFPVTTLEL
jgi:hypothetical protein